jgi:serine/threonine protein kinase
VGVVGQRVYFVEEYMAGAELSVLLMQQGRLSVARAGHVLRQAALGLQHAHEKGMFHGRLKPTAIIVGAPKVNDPTAAIAVKVCGFGLSRLYDGSERQGLEFLAPEQFASPGLTSITADIYSLGCLYYTMLMGVPPFPCLSLYDAAKFHNETVPPDIRTLRPDLPFTLASLLERMLAKDPAQRPQSMAEVSHALDTCPAHDLDSSTIDFSILQRTTDGSHSMILSDTHTNIAVGGSVTPAPWLEQPKVDRDAFAISPSTTNTEKRSGRHPRTPADISRMWFALYGLMFLAIVLAAFVLAKRFFG